MKVNFKPQTKAICEMMIYDTYRYIDKVEYCIKDLRHRLKLETQNVPFSESHFFIFKSKSKDSNVDLECLSIRVLLWC